MLPEAEAEQQRWWDSQKSLNADIRTVKLKEGVSGIISVSAQVRSMRSKTKIKMEVDENDLLNEAIVIASEYFHNRREKFVF